jgi:hypothetical protein
MPVYQLNEVEPVDRELTVVMTPAPPPCDGPAVVGLQKR